MKSNSFMIRDETMSTNMCEISQEIKDKMKKFRFRRATDNAGILLKINMKSMEVSYEITHLE